jgi:TatA/E family protein of Tat protein translocase
MASRVPARLARRPDRVYEAAMGFGFGELLIILVIVLIFFGAGRLPKLGEGLGKAIRGFKDSMRSEPPPPREEKRELPPDGGPPR